MRACSSLLDEGPLFLDGRRALLGYLEEDARRWSAVVKATGPGELYLVTYHLDRERHLNRSQRRLRRLK